MNDAETQKLILMELRSLIGGPRSLRFPPRLLCEGMCNFAGRAAALTLRTVEQTMELLSSEYNRAEVVQLQQGIDRCEGGTALDVANFLAIGIARPAAHKSPTHLVLGSLLGVLGQLAKADGMSLDELRGLIQTAHNTVSARQIDAFQRAAAAVRTN